MNDNILFIPDNNARLSLSKKLNLEFHVSMQDWEYEIADSDRIQEFIEEYDKSESTDKERQSLMEMILDSSNDLLVDHRTVEFEKFFSAITVRLKRESILHEGTINYWKTNDSEISKRLIDEGI